MVIGLHLTTMFSFQLVKGLLNVFGKAKFYMIQYSVRKKNIQKTLTNYKTGNLKFIIGIKNNQPHFLFTSC